MLHAGGYSIKAIHEWLGIAFILFGILHSIANWRLMKRYLSGLKGAIIVSMVGVTLGFSMLGPTEDQLPPSKAIFSQVMKAPLKNVAQLFNQNADTLAGQLRDKGYNIANVDNSIEEIARQNNTKADAIIAFIGSHSRQTQL